MEKGVDYGIAAHSVYRMATTLVSVIPNKDHHMDLDTCNPGFENAQPIRTELSVENNSTKKETLTYDRWQKEFQCTRCELGAEFNYAAASQ